MRLNITRQNWAQIGETAGWLKTAARKNPDKNPYLSSFQELEAFTRRSDAEDIYISYINEKKDSMGVKNIRDLSSPKIGVNPKSNFNTPTGVYTYPLLQAWDRIKSEQSLRSVPYRGEAPWIAVVKVDKSKKFVDDMYTKYDSSNYDADMNRLYSYFVPKYLTIARFEELKQLAAEKAKENNPIMSMWNFTRMLALLVHKYDTVKIDNEEDKQAVLFAFIVNAVKTSDSIFPEVVPGKLNTPALKWSGIMMKVLGYAGMADKSGKGYIHPSERTQAVFFDPSAYQVLRYIKNSPEKIQAMDEIPAESDQVIKTLKKLPAGHRLAPKLIETFLDSEQFMPSAYKKLLNEDTSRYPLIQSCKEAAFKRWKDKIMSSPITAFERCPFTEIKNDPKIQELVVHSWLTEIKMGSLTSITDCKSKLILENPDIHAALFKRWGDFLKGGPFLDIQNICPSIPIMVANNKELWMDAVTTRPALWETCFKVNEEIARSPEIIQYGMDYWVKRIQASPKSILTCPLKEIKFNNDIIDQALAATVMQKESAFSNYNIFATVDLIKLATTNSPHYPKVKEAIIEKIMDGTTTILAFKTIGDVWKDKNLWRSILLKWPKVIEDCPHDDLKTDPEIIDNAKKFYLSFINQKGGLNPEDCVLPELRNDVALIKSYYINNANMPTLYLDIKNKEVKNDPFIINAFKSSFKYNIMCGLVAIENCPFEDVKVNPTVWAELIRKRRKSFLHCPQTIMNEPLVISAIKTSIIENIEGAKGIENIPAISHLLKDVDLIAAAIRVRLSNLAVNMEDGVSVKNAISNGSVDRLFSRSIPRETLKSAFDKLGLYDQVIEGVKENAERLLHTSLPTLENADSYDSDLAQKTLYKLEALVGLHGAEIFGGIEYLSNQMSRIVEIASCNLTTGSSADLMAIPEIAQHPAFQAAYKRGVIVKWKKFIIQQLDYNDFSLDMLPNDVFDVISQDRMFWKTRIDVLKTHSVYEDLLKPPKCYDIFPKNIVEEFLLNGDPQMVAQTPKPQPETNAEDQNAQQKPPNDMQTDSANPANNENPVSKQSKNTWNSFFLTSSIGKLPF